MGYVYRPGPSGMNGRYFPLDFINGWILDFFLYNNNDNYMVYCKSEYPINEPEIIESKSRSSWGNEYEPFNEMLPGVQFDVFPSCYVKVPVMIVYKYGPKKGQQIPLDFATGFSGVLIDGALYRPQISFAVAG